MATLTAHQYARISRLWAGDLSRSPRLVHRLPLILSEQTSLQSMESNPRGIHRCKQLTLLICIDGNWVEVHHTAQLMQLG